jgi:hypothetical protein
LVVLVERGSDWPQGGDLALTVGDVEWQGIGQGHGHLQRRRAEVRVSGRRSAGRDAECTLWLPADSGVVAATAATVAKTAKGEDGSVGAGPDNGPKAA